MYKVAIIDDERKIVNLIKRLIDWDSHPIRLAGEAHDGVTGLELIRRERPDIVFLDIRMPGFNGIELIRRAKDAAEGTHFVIISGYRHFEYAHNAIKYGVEDYLLKPIKQEEINRTLRKITGKKAGRSAEEKRREQYALRESYRAAERFFLGGPGSGTFPSGEEFSPEGPAGGYEILLLKNDLNNREINPKIEDLLAEKTESLIEAELGTRQIRFFTVPSELGLFLLLILEDPREASVREALQKVIEGLHSLRDLFFDLQTTIARTAFFTEKEEASSRRDRAASLIQDRLLLGGGKVLEAPPAPPAPPGAPLPPGSWENLIKSVEILDRSGARRALAVLWAEAEKAGWARGEEVLGLAEELLGRVRHSLARRFDKLPPAEPSAADFARILRMQSRKESLFHLMEERLDLLLLRQEEAQEAREEKPISEAKRYMEEAFFEPLTLERVSEVVGLNASYFSSLFKKKTGMGFLDYLTNIRMEEAKGLLANPKRSLADTAGEVGYKDTKHFARQFKKVVGLSPSEYRKIYC